MTTITLYDVDASRTLEIVNELRQTLQQHTDFDYRFIPGGYNWQLHESKLPCAEFKFYDAMNATAFSLRYL
jgi:hypothetical protein